MKHFKIILLSLFVFSMGFVTIDDAFAIHYEIEVTPKEIEILQNTILAHDSKCVPNCSVDNFWYGIIVVPKFTDFGTFFTNGTALDTSKIGSYQVKYDVNSGSHSTLAFRTYNVVASTSSIITTTAVGENNPGGCNNCEAPTLGINSKITRIVENGFTYNGKSVDAERFFTPYPLLTVNIGEPNTAVFRIYEDIGPQNIGHFSFAFGLDKGQSISKSKAMIELDIDYDGTESVTVTDPENALQDVSVSTHVENCNDDGNDELKCLIVTINHTFRAPLGFNIVGTDVWDMERNAWQNYFNHGIEVTGESLNPAKEYDGVNRGNIYHLTETSKGIAIDEFGNSWTFNGAWIKDFVLPEKVKDGFTNVMTREHSEFTQYKDGVTAKAITQLLEMCSTCLDSFTDFDDSFTHSFSESSFSSKINPITLAIMDSENDKAQEIMSHILDPLLYRN